MLLAGAVLSLFAVLFGIIAYTSWQPRTSQTETASGRQPHGSAACSSPPDDAQPCTYRYFVADMRLVDAARAGPCPMHPGDSMLVVWAAYPDNHAFPDLGSRPVELQTLLFGPFASLDDENRFNYALGKAWTFPAGWPRTGWLVQAAWPQPPVAVTTPIDTDARSDLIAITHLTVPPTLPAGVYWLYTRADGLHGGGGNGGGVRCQMQPSVT
jgi:hypothetical protein